MKRARKSASQIAADNVASGRAHPGVAKQDVYAALHAAKSHAQRECDALPVVSALLARLQRQADALPAEGVRECTRVALREAIRRAAMRQRFLQNEGPLHEVQRRIQPFVRHHHALVAAAALAPCTPDNPSGFGSSQAYNESESTPSKRARLHTRVDVEAYQRAERLHAVSHSLGAAMSQRGGADAARVMSRTSVVDVCPRCPGHPVLQMDPVDAVLLCPSPACAFSRRFQSLTCPTLTHEDKASAARAGPNPTTEIYLAMQLCSAEESKPVPQEVLQAVMDELMDCGVPPTPRAVSYDAVSAALKTRRLAGYYDQRTQIRARIMGIPPPRFTVHQKATLAAMHAITCHMQPWVDSTKRAQNLQARLVFMCQRMGWWEHIVAPRFVSGPEMCARYDEVNRLVCAALGWPYYSCAATQANRAAATRFQAELELLHRSMQFLQKVPHTPPRAGAQPVPAKGKSKKRARPASTDRVGKAKRVAA
jgi:hypothetical protein